VPAACRDLFSTGSSSSIPTSDQVPQEMEAKFSPWAGTPATPEAVSCKPTATTGSPARRPAAAGASGSSSPTVSPALTGRFGNRCASRSSSRRGTGAAGHDPPGGRPKVDRRDGNRSPVPG
jgi:hypothetical protein